MPMLAFDLPRQVLFSGIVNGLTYGVMAVGIILIYRSSRVINLAIAAMGGFAAVLLARMVINWHFNYWVAFVLCVMVGAAVGWVVERTVIRRLFDAPRVILLVATIGVAQLLLFGQAILPQPSHVTSYPSAIRRSWDVAGVTVQGAHVFILIVVPIVTLALGFWLNRTKFGVAVRAAAENQDAARLAGINVKRMSTLVWVLAGTLAAIATICSAPITTTTSADVFTLGPGLLVRVLTAAIIGRMESPSLAVAGGVGIGTAEAIVFYNRPNDHGVLDVALLIVLLIAIIPLTRRSDDRETQRSWSQSLRVRPVPPALASRWYVKRGPFLTVGFGLVVAMLPLVVVHGASQQQLWGRVLLYAIVALSLTVLTGWAGQLSLGQFAFVGLGAMTTYTLVHRGVGFFPALGVAVVVGCAAAIIVGAPALRVRGLFLAVTSLAFAVATSSWLLSRSIFTGGAFTVTMPRAIIGSFSLAPERTYYAISLIALLLAVIVVARLRRSGFGRALLAVRDNEASAAALGISAARVKLTAFAISGVLASFAGGLLGGLYVTFAPTRFSATESLQVVSIVVIGGLTSVAGAIFGTLFVVGLPVLFSDSPNVALFTSGAGLLILLLFLPGGLAQLVYSARDALFRRLAREAPEAAEAPRPAHIALPHREVQPSAPIAVEVRDLTVRFGGHTAVESVHIEVRRGEVVGLIGANGAGKSTLMNAIGGFVPSSGRISITGTDVQEMSPARRARLGLGRTFQGAALFGDLTVRDTVALSFEAGAPTSLAGVVLGLPHAARADRAKCERATDIIHYLGLGKDADRFIDELSTGTRRIVEIACLVGSGANVLCLDEPTAGLGQREAEAFGPLLRDIREEFDASVLIIEHDMAVVMGISDRVYCLEAGRVICEGTSEEVRNDPGVIASYLGTPVVPSANDSGSSQPLHS